VILYTLEPYNSLGLALRTLAHVPAAGCAVARFPNGELHVRLDAVPRGAVALLLGAVAPPDHQLLSTLLLAHTLRKDGATAVVALLPYLGYARQDRTEPGTSLAAACIGQVLAAAGVAEVVTVDVHSALVPGLFPIPLRSLSPAPLFAREIATLDWPDAAVVAPDEGAVERSDAVRRAAGIERPLAYFAKRRTPAGIAHSALQGGVGRRAVVVDDILDTGGTLVSACEALARTGVEEIIVMVSHGLFTGSAWERLWALPVRRLYCTDTVPVPTALARMPITALPIAPVLADWVRQRQAEPPERWCRAA
jgi:ribose-phosphate pyrophosphokinase